MNVYKSDFKLPHCCTYIPPVPLYIHYCPFGAFSVASTAQYKYIKIDLLDREDL